MGLLHVMISDSLSVNLAQEKRVRSTVCIQAEIVSAFYEPLYLTTSRLK